MPEFCFRESCLHYTRTGTGSRVMLTFHGFGQTQEHFQPLARQLAGQFTIYSFDLFYHGKSTWRHRGQSLSKTYWKELMQQFLAQEDIRTFALAGFSMGGKFALATLESFADRITDLLLIAPDGIKTNFWYSLATYPSWTRKVFRSVVIHPRRFQQWASWMRQLRLVDKGIVRFAQSQMNTREKRHRVYYSWMVFKEFTFDMRHIAGLINTHRIPVRMFLGRYDKIITARNMQRLLKHIPQHQLVILEEGHNRLIEAVADYYKRQTLSPSG